MANIVEGVFAIHKPPGITSAQVIRDVQSHFNPSSLFAPWLQREHDIKNAESNNQRNKRKSWKSKQPIQVKIGHGGTLDPLATGVLILGVGSGTKALPQFLTCTKSYETVVLFGAATDTYDTEGKLVARKEYEHVTKEKVEEALVKFRGEFMQRPPIFSAIRVQGKHLYEYAREGKEVPVEIQERKMNVEKMELAEWLEGGSHEFAWPEQEAEGAVKNMAEKVLHLKDETEVKSEAAEVVGEAEESAKRKREVDEGESGVTAESSPKRIKSSPAPESGTTAIKVEVTESSPKRIKSSPAPVSDAPAIKAKPTETSSNACPAPAARIRMTVSSGFYVRSLAHDLGAAVGSLGLMAHLVRTRQGEFELGKNVLEYSDLAEGEKVWDPKVKKMLQDWQGEHEVVEGSRDRGGGRHERSAAKPAARAAVRRNSSSDEG
ncbi:pseudouridine synthase pus4 [Elasticomyces elasticus]|nr:pseudouridine synthase pus4 [Elasticomyces elasticus]KAK3667659.1 pseudouridine synthase pus4 [Elasticomyces elasticus]KAK4928386.1 pseudouridine synthase pus4 [Elasticomyces elasticus]KAK5767187.1 pseudouridine synthase pus4 [Elasticomyces elasticus]